MRGTEKEKGGGHAGFHGVVQPPVKRSVVAFFIAHRLRQFHFFLYPLLLLPGQG